MLKKEFDEMIGKESDATEYYEIYEPMYMALPERVTKADFVKMLNIDAIKESDEAIARKQARAEFIASKIDEMNELKKVVKEYKSQLTTAQNSCNYWKSQNDAEMVNFLKREVLWYKRLIKNAKFDIDQIKLIIE